VQIPEEEKLKDAICTNSRNSRREFYKGKFPGIPEREFPGIFFIEFPVALRETFIKMLEVLNLN